MIELLRQSRLDFWTFLPALPIDIHRDGVYGITKRDSAQVSLHACRRITHERRMERARNIQRDNAFGACLRCSRGKGVHGGLFSSNHDLLWAIKVDRHTDTVARLNLLADFHKVFATKTQNGGH